ncbi:hypothetical protein BJV78DRAFT_1184179, partial [Lactifluus subvellereus]
MRPTSFLTCTVLPALISFHLVSQCIIRSSLTSYNFPKFIRHAGILRPSNQAQMVFDSNAVRIMLYERTSISKRLKVGISYRAV